MCSGLHQFHTQRIAGALIALFFVCISSTCFANDSNNFAGNKLTEYQSPYRLNHHFLFGFSSSGLLTGDKTQSGAIGGSSIGITTEYFPLPVYSLGLRFEYYHFSTSYRNSAGLGVRSITITQKLVPAAGAGSSPYLTLGLGSASNRNSSQVTVTAGVGFQIRPTRRSWVRVEATAVAMGLGPELENVSIDRLNGSFQVDAYGVRLEFGIVR